jgi:hypothetical protein
MTCKDCVHYEVCKEHLIECAEHGEAERILNPCAKFKNKADFVELPFVAMVEQFIKDGKFDKKRVAHNGRFAVVYIDKSKWSCPLIDITEQFYNDEKAKERIRVLKGGADNG